MNNFDLYIPIDIHAPIKTSAKANIQRYSNNNPVILFQLFDGRKPLMLNDTNKLSIAFTNTNNKSIGGHGNLQVINPHRGTISYELNADDITMSGLHTITLAVTTGNSYFTVQSVIMAQDIGSDLNDILHGNTNGNSNNNSCKGNCTNCTDCQLCKLPCTYYNSYCRVCRRCKWVWENNTFPKPVCFDSIKLCKNPNIQPPIINYANIEGYEKAYIPTVIDEDGYIKISVNGIDYKCDIGKHGALYLVDKSQPMPPELTGLYMGDKLTLYYNTSEKITDETFDINSLFK